MNGFGDRDVASDRIEWRAILESHVFACRPDLAIELEPVLLECGHLFACGAAGGVNERPLAVVRRLPDHPAIGPSGGDAQSTFRTRSRISPGPTNLWAAVGLAGGVGRAHDRERAEGAVGGEVIDSSGSDACTVAGG